MAEFPLFHMEGKIPPLLRPIDRGEIVRLPMMRLLFNQLLSEGEEIGVEIEKGDRRLEREPLPLLSWLDRRVKGSEKKTVASLFDLGEVQDEEFILFPVFFLDPKRQAAAQRSKEPIVGGIFQEVGFDENPVEVGPAE